MAIDPTIALKIQPAQPLDLTKLQQLRNLVMQEQATAQQIAASRAQEELTRAQLPGVVAESDVRVRAQKFNTDVLGNAAKFTNADGSPNITKFINFATEKGFLREAQSIAATDLTNQGQAIANATNEQQRQIALTNFMNTGINNASLLLHATPDKERASAAQTYANFLNSQVKGSGDQLLNMFGTVDPQTGAYKVDNNRINAVRQSTINAATQESQGLEFAQRFYTAEGRNPNSKQSKDFREFVRVQSGGNVKIPEGTSLFDALMNPTYRETASQYVSSQIMPAGTRAQAVGTTAMLQSTIANYDSAIGAIDAVPKQLLPTRLGTIGSEAFKKFVEQNPALAGLETAIQVHNNQFPNDLIDPMRQSLDEVRSKLRAGRKQLENQAAGAAAITQTGAFPTPTGTPPVGAPVRETQRLDILEQELAKAVKGGKKADIEALMREINATRRGMGMPAREMPAAPSAAPAAAPAAAPQGLIRMINKSGKVINVHPSREAEAKAAGYNRVTK